MQTYILACLVLFLASFSKGLSGFGVPLFAVPLLSLFLNIKTVVPLVTLVASILTCLLLIELRQHFEWRKIKPLLLGAIAGIPLGVYLLKRLDKSILLGAVGVILIVYTLLTLFTRPIKARLRERWAYLFGFISGCLGGGLYISGPPIIVYNSLQNWTKDEIKASLQGYFLVSGLIVVLFHAVSGLTTQKVFGYLGVSLPFILLGNYLGSRFYGRIKEEQYKRLILLLLGFLGVFMIYRAFTS